MEALLIFFFVLGVGLMPLWLDAIIPTKPSTRTPYSNWKRARATRYELLERAYEEQLSHFMEFGTARRHPGDYITADKIVTGSITANKITILHGNPLPQRWGPASELTVEGTEFNRGDRTPEHLTNHVPQACGPDCDHLLPPQGSDDGLPPR